jgi:hypothetical protein
MTEKDFQFLKFNKSVKESAREYYHEWIKAPLEERIHPELGDITISRVGWRHITRQDRKQNRIINSLALLSVAKKIITKTSKCYQVRQLETKSNLDGTFVLTDFLSIKCNVTFPFRQGSLIQVILKRKRKLNGNNDIIGSKIWFYSIYEPLAKK